MLFFFNISLIVHFLLTTIKEFKHLTVGKWVLKKHLIK